MAAKHWLTILALAATACGRRHSSGAGEFVPASDEHVAVMGRVERTESGMLRFGYPGVTLRLSVEGPALGIRAGCGGSNCRLGVVIDGKPTRVVPLTPGVSDQMLVDGLAPGTHTIDVVQRTETWQGVVSVHGFMTAGRLWPAKPWPKRRLLFVGDSVTCGEGIDRAPGCGGDKAASWNAYASYGMLAARALDAQCQLVCYGGRGLVRDWQGKRDVLNAPQFFELALADQKRPIRWDHTRYVPDAVVVSLGTNDFVRALGAPPERESYVATYVTFVRRIRSLYPDAHIFLTEGAILEPPEKTRLVEYLHATRDRLGDPRLHVVPATHYPGDACDAHPTRAQHAAMAEELEPVIARALGWR